MLTAGNFKARDFDTMTIAWGSLGTLLNKPFVQTFVRPMRHTFGFTEKHETFTLCSFPANYRQALKRLGTLSGRDGDKIAKASLTPVASSIIPAPAFAEADLILECKKLFADDLDPRKCLDDSLHGHCPAKDYHRVHFGEILSVRGVETFQGDSRRVPFGSPAR